MHRESDPFVSSSPPSTPPIFLRDFAYPHSARVVLTERMRMASERSISKSLARDFAGAMSHFLGTPARSHLWWMSAGGRDADEAKTLRARLLSGPMVDIYVGKERKHWSLHRHLLCHHSPYFETELLGHEVPKKQNQDGTNKLELLDDDPRGFELFVKWLYQGQLDEASELDNEGKYEYAVACHKLYLLSSKFSMPHLSNLAMDAYRHNLNAAHLVPDADEINDIYRSSPPGSPFRRLMTKIAARQIMDPEIDKDAETYRPAFENNPDFAVEMVNAIRYMSGGMLFDNPTDGNACDWHDHGDGRDCSGQQLGKGKSKASTPYINGVNGAPSRPLQSPTMTRVRSTPLAELPVDKRTPRKLNLPPHQSAARPRAQQTSTTRGKGRVVSTPLQNATGVSPSPTKPVTGRPRPVLGKRASSYTNANGIHSTAAATQELASAETTPVKLLHRPKEQSRQSPPNSPANSPSAPSGAPSKAPDTAGSPRKVAGPNVNARRAVSGPAHMNGFASSTREVTNKSPVKAAPEMTPSTNHERTHVNGIVKQLNGTSSSRQPKRAKFEMRREQSSGTGHDGFSVRRAGAPSEAGTTTTAAEKSVADTMSGTSQDLERRQPVKLKRKVPG